MDRSIIDYYDALASKYDSARFQNSYGRHLDWQERQILDRYLPRESSRVLDLGCGTGRLSDRADEGCDASKRSLAFARKKHPMKRFVLADIADLPYLDSSFDAVFCFHVLMHCEMQQIEATFREAARVLKPGGVFIGDIASAMRRRVRQSQPVGWHGATSLDSRKFTALALRAGLRPLATTGVMFLPLHRLPERWRRSMRLVDYALAAALPDAASYLVGVFKKRPPG